MCYSRNQAYVQEGRCNQMNLREARLRQALSIRELAQRAGVSPRTIVQTEQGRQTPTLKTARKISTALGMKPEEIQEFAEMIGEALEGKVAA